MKDLSPSCNWISVPKFYSAKEGFLELDDTFFLLPLFLAKFDSKIPLNCIHPSRKKTHTHHHSCNLKSWESKGASQKGPLFSGGGINGELQ